MPAWDDVRYFLEVSRGRTLAAAAKKLGVDYTTVGRRIAALERELGSKLFFPFQCIVIFSIPADGIVLTLF